MSLARRPQDSHKRGRGPGGCSVFVPNSLSKIELVSAGVVGAGLACAVRVAARRAAKLGRAAGRHRHVLGNVGRGRHRNRHDLFAAATLATCIADPNGFEFGAARRAFSQR